MRQVTHLLGWASLALWPSAHGPSLAWSSSWGSTWERKGGAEVRSLGHPPYLPLPFPEAGRDVSLAAGQAKQFIGMQAEGRLPTKPGTLSLQAISPPAPPHRVPTGGD